MLYYDEGLKNVLIDFKNPGPTISQNFESKEEKEERFSIKKVIDYLSLTRPGEKISIHLFGCMAVEENVEEA